jgi:hypothetical protein
VELPSGEKQFIEGEKDAAQKKVTNTSSSGSKEDESATSCMKRLEQHHAQETANNARDAEERRAVRAAANAAKAAKAPKPFTPTGPSHRPKSDAGAVDPLVPTGAAEEAKEEARQQASKEAAKEHERTLKEAEAARVAAILERLEKVRVGNAIAAGNA